MTKGQLSSSGSDYSKLQLLIILLTPLLVMAASTGLYYSGWLVPDDQVNRGILLDPVLNLEDLGLDLDKVNPDRQWLMIQTSGECREDCLERVRIQRQIHVALGKYEPRVSRVLMTESQGVEHLSREYPGMTVVDQAGSVYSEAFRSRIPAQFKQNNYIFVVDPLGNVPLYFTPENDYKDQLTDIKKMLKLSTIG